MDGVAIMFPPHNHQQQSSINITITASILISPVIMPILNTSLKPALSQYQQLVANVCNILTPQPSEDCGVKKEDAIVKGECMELVLREGVL